MGAEAFAAGVVAHLGLGWRAVVAGWWGLQDGPADQKLSVAEAPPPVTAASVAGLAFAA